MRIFQQQVEKDTFDKIVLEEGIVLDQSSRSLFERKKELFYEKPQQAACAAPDEEVGLDCVQSFVSNMSAPTSLEELEYTRGFTLPENLLSGPSNEWTAPRWAKAGDVVFFMHSKTARSSITRLRTELKERKSDYRQFEFDQLSDYIDHALEIHAKYGGKIFAVGRVCGAPEYADPDEFLSDILHWRSRHYLAIDNIQALKTPLDIASFREYVYVSRGGATTPLFDKNFVKLRDDIELCNLLPGFVKRAIARPVPLREINRKNWVEVANAYRRAFILESQFRTFYVDYLLREIGDQRKFFTECRCQRADINDSFMDYVIWFAGKYLPVETKLAVSAEPNIVSQVSKYVYNSNVYLREDNSRKISCDEFHDGKVLIIDTEKIYLYDHATGEVTEIFTLDRLTDHDKLDDVRKAIFAAL